MVKALDCIYLTLSSVLGVLVIGNPVVSNGHFSPFRPCAFILYFGFIFRTVVSVSPNEYVGYPQGK